MGSYLVIAAIGCFLQLFILHSAGYPADTADNYNDANYDDSDYAVFMEIINVKPKILFGRYGTRFYCNAVISATSNNVNRLSPFHVGIVAALGDSLTAGLGAGAIFFTGILKEYKGLSWSIGGRKSLSRVTTLPNILKLFNPDLTGYSERTHLFYDSKEALNRAVSGAKVRDLPDQAEDLVNELKKMGESAEDKWKVLTIFIGSNDLCEVSTCTNDIDTTVNNFMKHLHAAIKILYKNVRKMFVNLLLLLDVSVLAPLRGLVCDLLHSFVCDCATDMNPEKASQVAKAINSRIIEEFQLNQPYDSEDFTVVVQPMYSNTIIPTKSNGSPDKSYLAPDCFHFSQKTHSLTATYLWNNMLQPVGRKTASIDWTKGRQLTCPDKKFPYFRTNANSKLQ